MLRIKMEYKLFIAIVVFLIAYYLPTIKINYFNDQSINNNNIIEQEIINSWKFIIKTPKRQKPLKLSIG